VLGSLTAAVAGLGVRAAAPHLAGTSDLKVGVSVPDLYPIEIGGASNISPAGRRAPLGPPTRGRRAASRRARHTSRVVTPPTAPRDDEAAWRAARRRAARNHHPDVGGTTEEYLAALAEVDARFGRRPDGRPGGPRVFVTTTLRRRVLRVALRGARDASRAVRSRLPPGVPGSRRYGNL